MANYNTSEFRAGLKILMDGDPCVIVENEFVKPGKGQAFNRVRFRNLITGRVWERTFKSGESLPAADIPRDSADGSFTRRMESTFGVEAPVNPKEDSHHRLANPALVEEPPFTGEMQLESWRA